MLNHWLKTPRRYWIIRTHCSYIICHCILSYRFNVIAEWRHGMNSRQLHPVDGHDITLTKCPDVAFTLQPEANKHCGLRSIVDMGDFYGLDGAESDNILKTRRTVITVTGSQSSSERMLPYVGRLCSHGNATLCCLIDGE